MMYIKLLVLFGFDFNFPLIFGINKLYQIKASFPTFQLSDRQTDKQTDKPNLYINYYFWHNSLLYFVNFIKYQNQITKYKKTDKAGNKFKNKMSITSYTFSHDRF